MYFSPCLPTLYPLLLEEFGEMSMKNPGLMTQISDGFCYV